MSSREQIEQCSSFSWWWDSHNRPPHSQWLHSTLSELDNKIKMILDLIDQDNGDTFAKRAEMYYEKRPQLIEMVQDLHRSYRALADKYDQLKSESSIKASNYGSFSNSFRKGKQHHSNNPPNNYVQVIEAPNFSCDTKSIGSSNETANEEDCNNEKTNELKQEFEVKEEVWIEVQKKFSELFEENSCKQAELIRRNDEKRKVINELRIENMILTRKLGNGSTRGKQTHKRILKGFFCFA